MDYMMLVATLVGQLALIAKDPALGYRGQAITEALGLLTTIIGKGEAARAELEALAAQIQQMVAENREPTKPEWQALRDLSKQHHLILNPPPPEPVAEDGPAAIDDNK
jgi:hypothetical protein